MVRAMSEQTPEQRARPRRADTLRRQASHRRRRLAGTALRVTAFVVGIIVVAGGTVLAVRSFGGADEDPGPTATAGALPGFGVDDAQPTVLLATFDETDPGQRATQVILLADNGDGGTVVITPSTTIAEIPGHGPLQIGLAYGFGQGPLLELTLDNLLGIDTDTTIGVSRQGWSIFFGRFGGLDLEVPVALTGTSASGQRQVRFESGAQFLDGERVAEYLTFEQSGETELQRIPRVQLVLQTLLDEITEDPTRLDAVFADGAPMLDTTEPGLLREMLVALAADRAANTLDVRPLPVTSIGSGDQGSYRLDDLRAEDLVASRLAGSVPDVDDVAGRRLQILNGNGEPGIGQAITARLQPGGFRVVLTRNADRFDYATTRIVVYDDSPEQLALARDVRQRLGVGQVELSETPQGVVDITVVVGADFTG